MEKKKQKLIPRIQNLTSKTNYRKNKKNNKNNIYVFGYPLVDAVSEGLVEYFKNNPNITGMAIGAGLNGIGGKRRVVLNPNLKDSNARNSVYMNESYRHFFDANNVILPTITSIQRQAYKGTPYEDQDKRIQETEAARYLSGDTSHHLNDTQKAQLGMYDFIYPGRLLPEIIIYGNKKAEGENTYSAGKIADALWSLPNQEYLGEPAHHYDFAKSEAWADAHGYFPNARCHRNDEVKKPAHPSHSSKGTWSKDGKIFNLTDVGMKDPNYIFFGLADGGQDPQATLMYKGVTVLPEITITPKGNYYMNSYDNYKLSYDMNKYEN